MTVMMIMLLLINSAMLISRMMIMILTAPVSGVNLNKKSKDRLNRWTLDYTRPDMSV